jgi:hypothetical protein
MRMINKAVLLYMSSMLLSGLTLADTKQLSCTQQNDDGIIQVVKITLDDAAEKAEVLLYGQSAECAKTMTCETKLYQKEVLPNAIRLKQADVVGSLVYGTVIDVDRTSLDIATKTSLDSPVGKVDDYFSGSCSMTVQDTKKLL